MPTSIETETQTQALAVQIKFASADTILDVNPSTYAEIRDSLREQGHADQIGNKLIHLREIALRERDPMEVPNNNFKGLLLFGGFFAVFIALLVWTATGIWR